MACVVMAMSEGLLLTLSEVLKLLEQNATSTGSVSWLIVCLPTACFTWWNEVSIVGKQLRNQPLACNLTSALVSSWRCKTRSWAGSPLLADRASCFTLFFYLSPKKKSQSSAFQRSIEISLEMAAGASTRLPLVESFMICRAAVLQAGTILFVALLPRFKAQGWKFGRCHQVERCETRCWGDAEKPGKAGDPIFQLL